MAQQQLTEFENQVLVALVEGHAARTGLKERMRALNEWEIARRSGFTDISYAAYAEHPTRAKVASALSALQRNGLISLWDRGVQYDSFVPTAAGARSVSGEDDPVSRGPGEPAPAALSPEILQRLDQILQVLHSIDHKLKGR